MKTLNVKMRLTHDYIALAMAKCKEWHKKALDEIGFLKWAELNCPLPAADLKLIFWMMDHTDPGTRTLTLYDRKIKLNADTIRRCYGLNEGKTPYVERTPEPALLAVEGPKFASYSRRGEKAVMISGIKCQKQLEIYMDLEERPEPDEVFLFQKSFILCLLVDVLVPSQTRFSSLNYMSMGTAKLIKDTDWAELALNYLMERLTKWKKTVALMRLIIENPLQASEVKISGKHSMPRGTKKENPIVVEEVEEVEEVEDDEEDEEDKEEEEEEAGGDEEVVKKSKKRKAAGKNTGEEKEEEVGKKRTKARRVEKGCKVTTAVENEEEVDKGGAKKKGKSEHDEGRVASGGCLFLFQVNLN